MTPRARVRTAHIRNFRNLRDITLSPGPRLNVFHGDNGAGKTAILEALALASTLRSFRGSANQDLVTNGKEGYVVRVSVDGEPLPDTIVATFAHGQRKQTQLNKKRVTRRSQVSRKLPVVVFAPNHLSLASGSPAVRRQFLDVVGEQVKEGYAGALREYDRALRARNRLIKDRPQDERSLLAYEGPMARAGAHITADRIALCDALTPSVQDIFRRIVGPSPTLRISYRATGSPAHESFGQQLKKNREKDIQRGHTTAGPHADDLVLTLRDQAPAKHQASQGQQRAMALALKLAELTLLAATAQRTPVMLLDDVSSELDSTKNRQLFAVLGELGGQVFLTTTDPGHVHTELERVDFHVQAGEVTTPR